MWYRSHVGNVSIASVFAALNWKRAFSYQHFCSRFYWHRRSFWSTGVNILIMCVWLSSLSHPHYLFRLTGKLIQDREYLYLIMTSFYINQLSSVLSMHLYFIFSMAFLFLAGFLLLESWQKCVCFVNLCLNVPEGVEKITWRQLKVT